MKTSAVVYDYERSVSCDSRCTIVRSEKDWHPPRRDAHWCEWQVSRAAE